MSNNQTFRLALSLTNLPSSFVTLLDSRKSRSRAETASLPARIACHGLSRHWLCLTMAAESGAGSMAGLSVTNAGEPRYRADVGKKPMGV
jgi:hypothetical protein